jgi:uncharacterized coiled-coil DUF342 family protein
MPKHKEAPSITIANLERENRNLTARCTDLVEARDGAIKQRLETMQQRDSFGRKNMELQSTIDQLRQENQSLRRATDYNDGYISRVKETDKHFYGEPGSSA